MTTSNGTSQVMLKAVVVPKGEYWVGDPCYGVPDDRWMEWLNAADFENQRYLLVADIDGRAVVGVTTAFGDGEYRGTDGKDYPVDAGLIGVVPVELVKDENPFGMNRVTFPRDFECSFSERGLITLGHIEIDTAREGEA